MINQRYVVKKGDTLWDLAGKFLGSPDEWPRLYAFNNAPEVVRVTGKNIQDPDVLQVGQTLLLPTLPGFSQPKPERTTKIKQPTKLRNSIKDSYVPFMIKYNLDDIPMINYTGPAFNATVKLSGDVVITIGHLVPLTYVSNKGVELNYKGETDGIFQQLISDPSISWDRKSNSISFGCNMTTKSSPANAPCSSIGVAVSTAKPVPVLRSEIKYPTLKGYIRGDRFCAMNMKAVVELEPKTERPRDGNPDSSPVRVHSRSSVGAWTFATGVVMMAGILISNYFTRGRLQVVDEVLLPLALSKMGFSVNQKLPGQRPIKIDVLTGDPDYI